MSMGMGCGRGDKAGAWMGGRFGCGDGKRKMKCLGRSLKGMRRDDTQTQVRVRRSSPGRATSRSAYVSPFLGPVAAEGIGGGGVRCQMSIRQGLEALEEIGAVIGWPCVCAAPDGSCAGGWESSAKRMPRPVKGHRCAREKRRARFEIHTPSIDSQLGLCLYMRKSSFGSVAVCARGSIVRSLKQLLTRAGLGPAPRYFYYFEESSPHIHNLRTLSGPIEPYLHKTPPPPRLDQSLLPSSSLS